MGLSRVLSPVVFASSINKVFCYDVRTGPLLSSVSKAKETRLVRTKYLKQCIAHRTPFITILPLHPGSGLRKSYFYLPPEFLGPGPNAASPKVTASGAGPS